MGYLSSLLSGTFEMTGLLHSAILQGDGLNPSRVVPKLFGTSVPQLPGQKLAFSDIRDSNADFSFYSYTSVFRWFERDACSGFSVFHTKPPEHATWKSPAGTHPEKNMALELLAWFLVHLCVWVVCLLCFRSFIVHEVSKQVCGFFCCKKFKMADSNILHMGFVLRYIFKVSKIWSKAETCLVISIIYKRVGFQQVFWFCNERIQTHCAVWKSKVACVSNGLVANTMHDVKRWGLRVPFCTLFAVLFWNVLLLILPQNDKVFVKWSFWCSKRKYWPQHDGAVVICVGILRG